MTSYKVENNTLIIPFASPRRVISSAVHGGGIVKAHAVLNHQVYSDPIDRNREGCHSDVLEDPSRYLGKLAERLKIRKPCVGLMTAVNLRCLVLKREETDGIWIEGFFTVGVANAVRAGEPTRTIPSKNSLPQIGTINIILVTNVRFSVAAMVCAVGVATEGKTSMLAEEKVRSSSGCSFATGTGTDVIAIVGGKGPYCRYGGTHTKIGELIGRVVSRGVMQGLKNDRKWKTFECSV